MNRITSPRKKTKDITKKGISGKKNDLLKNKGHTFDGVSLRVAPNLGF